MHPWILTKLSYGILKESLIHPKAILVLDKTTGKVSHRYEISGVALEDLGEIREAVDMYRQWKNRKATPGEEAETDMRSRVWFSCRAHGPVVLMDPARFCPHCGAPLTPLG